MPRLGVGVGLGLSPSKGWGAHPFDGYRIVTTRGDFQYASTATSGANATIEGRQYDRITRAGLTGVRALFTNWYVSEGPTSYYPERPGPNDLSVQAALELVSPSAYRPWLKDGGEFTVPAGGSVLTDEITAADIAGTPTFAQYAQHLSRTSVLLAPGQVGLQGGRAARIPTTEFMSRHNPVARQAYGVGPMTQAAGGGSQRAYHPVGLIAPVADPTYKVLIGLGDSIIRGNVDADDTVEGAYGYMQRACLWDGSKAIPSLNLGRSSDSAQSFLAGANTLRLDLMRLGTHLLLGFGVNEFVNFASTGAQTAANLRTIAAMARQRGVQKVAVCTVGPRTASPTTGWAAYRTALNAELVVGPDFDAVFDYGAVMSDVGNPAAFKAGYSTDGIHPNATGTTALTAALKADILTPWGF